MLGTKNFERALLSDSLPSASAVAVGRGRMQLLEARYDAIDSV